MAWIVTANREEKKVRTEKQAIEIGKLLSEFIDEVEAYPILTENVEATAYKFERGEAIACECYAVPCHENGKFVRYRTYFM